MWMGQPQIPPVEGDQDVSPPVDRRFQYHFIARIAKLRTPQKVCFHGLGLITIKYCSAHLSGAFPNLTKWNKHPTFVGEKTLPLS